MYVGKTLFAQRGLISTRIATRRVEDRYLEMSEGEAALYAALEGYITQTYNQAARMNHNEARLGHRVQVSAYECSFMKSEISEMMIANAEPNRETA